MAAALYVIYDATTGEILSTGFADDIYSASMIQPGQGILFGASGNSSTQYVDVGVPEVLDRPVQAGVSIDATVILADGFDAATITGIPAGWNYEISNGVSGVTDGTDVVLTALEPGVFTIKFTNWPYQDIEYTINASATPL